VLAADLAVDVGDSHVGAGDVDDDLQADAGLSGVESLERDVELLELAGHRRLLEARDDLQLASGRNRLPVGGVRGRRREEHDERQGLHRVLQVSMRASTSSRFTKWCRSAAPICARSTSARTTDSPRCTHATPSESALSGATMAGSGTR